MATQEANAINRVLKARGLPQLGEPGVVEALAFMVEDHQHFMELLRACEPPLRRDMYESMRPHLRFTALPLDHYISMAGAHADAAKLPVIDEQGKLREPYTGSIVTTHGLKVELWVSCAMCGAEATFAGAHTGHAIHIMRNSGWAYDESTKQRHLCPQCLDGEPIAMDTAPS